MKNHYLLECKTIPSGALKINYVQNKCTRKQVEWITHENGQTLISKQWQLEDDFVFCSSVLNFNIIYLPHNGVLMFFEGEKYS